MITPLDIRKLEFNQKLRGFDKEEVRTSLDSIADELENQIRENKALSEKLKLTEERLNHFRLIEKTLQDSVVTMQITLEEKKKGAEQEAELIIQEARLKADAETEDYISRVRELKSEINQLEKQKLNYFIRFKNFLNSQREWMDAMENSGDSEDENNIIALKSREQSEKIEPFNSSDQSSTQSGS